MLDHSTPNGHESAPDPSPDSERPDADELGRARACNDALIKALVSVIGSIAQAESRAGTDDEDDDAPALEADQSPEIPPSVCLADISAAEVPWLWRGRIPCGRLTFLQGPKGTGKSFLALDIAARVTRGAPWPDAPDQPGTPGSVLLVTAQAQDHLAQTIIPRLTAAGADLAKVHALQAGLDHRGEPRTFHFSLTERLEQAMAAHPDLKLVVIDPINAFVGFSNDRRFNTFSNGLRRIAKLAERYGVAVLLVNATDPGSNGRTWQFGADILPELKEAARAVWSLSEDPLDPSNRLFLPVRINLAAEPTGLRFTIDRERGVLDWSDEPVALRGGDLPRADRSGSGSDVAKATAWLQPFLADGAVAAETILREGAAAGHSRRALYAAKARLGVRSSKGTGHFAGGWTWELGQDRSAGATLVVRKFRAPTTHSESIASAYGFEDSNIPPRAASEHPEDSNIPGPPRHRNFGANGTASANGDGWHGGEEGGRMGRPQSG